MRFWIGVFVEARKAFPEFARSVIVSIIRMKAGVTGFHQTAIALGFGGLVALFDSVADSR
jgi:hypothetical protein